MRIHPRSASAPSRILRRAYCTIGGIHEVYLLAFKYLTSSIKCLLVNTSAEIRENCNLLVGERRTEDNGVREYADGEVVAADIYILYLLTLRLLELLDGFF